MSYKKTIVATLLLTMLTVIGFGAIKQEPVMPVLKVWDPVNRQWIEAAGAAGDFSGPSSSTLNAHVRFADTSGKKGKNGTVLESDSGDLTVVKSITGITGETFVIQPIASEGKRLDLLGGSASVTGNGGGVNCVAADGGSTSGDAGSFLGSAGTVADGNGGNTSLVSTNGVGTNKNGGNFSVTLGKGTGSGDDGTATIDSRVIAVREYARKTADTSIANSTTFLDDVHLAGLTMSANTTYELIGWLHWRSTSATPDAKITFTIPTGATIGVFVQHIDFNNNFVADAINASGSSSGRLEITTSRDGVTSFGGTIVVGSTAGVLNLQWAQQTSNATPTVLKEFSYMKLSKI